MIYFLLFLFFIISEIVLFIYMPQNQIKELLMILLGIFIGATGFSLKDFINNLKHNKKTKKNFKRIEESIKKYFSNSFSLDYNKKIPKEDLSENDILNLLLGGKFNVQISNSIKLCYYCKKWNETKEAVDYDNIRKISDSLGLKYGKIDNETKLFLKIYNSLIKEKNTLQLENSKILDFKEIFSEFILNYYKDLQFFEIRERFYQNKNLQDTLINIIKEGKLSNYGISKETIKRLEGDLNKIIKNSKLFLILANNSNPEDRKNWKNFIYKFGRIGGTGTATNMGNLRGGKWQIYIIKTPEVYSTKSLLKEIKKAGINSEAIIEIIPLNIESDEIYTFPFNQSFMNENLKNAYNVINWFKEGYNHMDSALWSEVANSTITPNELLSVIPFNIFCKGILPCEQNFLIKNYSGIKDKFKVSTLSDWANQDKKLLSAIILNFGKPDYSDIELSKFLKINKDGKDIKEKIEERIKTLSGMIIDGAKDFNNSLKTLDLIESNEK